MSAILYEAHIADGVSTNVEIREWRYKGTYELTKQYRDTPHNGALGGYAIELDTEPLHIQAPCVIDDSDYAALKLLENVEVTLLVKDNSGSYTVKILNVLPGRMIEPTPSTSTNRITTTATFREVTINFIRES